MRLLNLDWKTEFTKIMLNTTPVPIHFDMTSDIPQGIIDDFQPKFDEMLEKVSEQELQTPLPEDIPRTVFIFTTNINQLNDLQEDFTQIKLALENKFVSDKNDLEKMLIWISKELFSLIMFFTSFDLTMIYQDLESYSNTFIIHPFTRTFRKLSKISNYIATSAEFNQQLSESSLSELNNTIEILSKSEKQYLQQVIHATIIDKLNLSDSVFEHLLNPLNYSQNSITNWEDRIIQIIKAHYPPKKATSLDCSKLTILKLWKMVLHNKYHQLFY